MGKRNIQKKNFQSVKQNRGYVKTVLPMILVVIFAAMLGTLFEILTEDDAYVQGKITGTHYENQMLGIAFDAPDGFEMSTQEQIDEQLKANVSFSNAMKNATARRMEMAAISEKGTSISIMTWNMEGDDMSAEQYVKTSQETIVKQYESKVKFRNKGEISTKEIAGEEYACLSLEFVSDDVERCSESYVRMVDGYAVMIGIAYGPENVTERDLLLKAMQKF